MKHNATHNDIGDKVAERGQVRFASDLTRIDRLVDIALVNSLPHSSIQDGRVLPSSLSSANRVIVNRGGRNISKPGKVRALRVPTAG